MRVLIASREGSVLGAETPGEAAPAPPSPEPMGSCGLRAAQKGGGASAAMRPSEWLGSPPPGAPEVPWREVREHIQATNPHRGRCDGRNALAPSNNDPVSCYRWYGPVLVDWEDSALQVYPPFSGEDVEAYRRRYEAGSGFPAVALIWGDTWRTEGQLVVYDGAHRIQAAKACEGRLLTYVGIRRSTGE